MIANLFGLISVIFHFRCWKILCVQHQYWSTLIQESCTHCIQMQANTDGQEYLLRGIHPLSMERRSPWNHPVSYVNGLFWGSQLNLAVLTKEAYAIYMSIKKSTFYLAGHEIKLRIDHLPLKKFLRKMTLNNMVNNWSNEIESFNINFVHISGKANVLADTLSRLIDTDPDLRQQPELEGHEFGKNCFETLPTGERISSSWEG